MNTQPDGVSAMSAELGPLPPCYFTHPFGRELWNDEQVRAYTAAAVAAERERCAQVCELHSRLTWNDDRKAQSRVLAEEIRRWPNTKLKDGHD